MPLYDCMLLLKPHVEKLSVVDLLAKVGKHVYRRNGVLTGVKSFGTVQLGYGIKKLDGRYYQGLLTQMTMMTPPSFNSELQYLNKEDRLLRWLLVKHRNVKLGTWTEDVPMQAGDPMRGDFKNFRIILRDPNEGGGVFNEGSSDDDDDDDGEDDEDY